MNTAPGAPTQDQLKALVAQAALQYVERGALVGVGTGSTVNLFIDALATIKDQIAGAVSSSVASTERLRALGIAVFDANDVDRLPVYIDGADEIDGHGCMVKGGGAALTREKIVAALADRFVCIADASKLVDVLGAFPLPVEVIPMASARIVRQFAALGGHAVLREHIGQRVQHGRVGHDDILRAGHRRPHEVKEREEIALPRLHEPLPLERGSIPESQPLQVVAVTPGAVLLVGLLAAGSLRRAVDTVPDGPACSLGPYGVIRRRGTDKHARRRQHARHAHP